MTPEAQRIAIAEACGWKFDNNKCIVSNPLGTAMPFFPPDYLNDLNAMHEAEKVLSEFQMRKYGYNLQGVTHWYCVGVIEDYPRHLALARISHATAAQRAEAFLKTLGLWKE